jgi:Divergent InlB B-repeat domain
VLTSDIQPAGPRLRVSRRTILALPTGRSSAGRPTVPLLAALIAAVLALLGLAASASAAEPRFVTSFGSKETGRLAVNEQTGVVYVINEINHVVDRFSSSGEPLEPLEAEGLDLCEQGEQSDIAVDNSGGAHEGWVYVAGECGIEGHLTAFDSTGTEKWQMEPPRLESGPTQVCGVAVTATGSLWYANQFNGEGFHEVNRETGEPEGSGVPGKFFCHFAFDPTGNLFGVAVGEGHRGQIEKWVGTTQGAFAGGSNLAVATDAAGDVYGLEPTQLNSYTPAGAQLYLPLAPHEASEFFGVAVDSKRERIYLTDGNDQVEVFTTAPLTDPFTANITGTGTVQCEVQGAGSFGSCASEYPEGTVLNVKAAPGAGFAFAGWLGCKHTGANECQLTFGSSAQEITAVFLKEGTEGKKGETGTPGAPGGEGKAGSLGATGPGGAQGPAGPAGPGGPAGAPGARGPAGNVTCKVSYPKKKGKVKVTCTVKAAAASAASVHWRLARSGRTVRHGSGRGTLHIDLSGLRRGRYQLRIMGHSGSALIVVA